VTLADRNFLPQAKQLFSSVYWNAGWAGDYMLLAHEVPEDELKWFKDKGILIRNVKPLFAREFGNERLMYPGTVTSKLHVFSVDFKKWNVVIFVDADCIVRYTLDALTRTKYFSAALDWPGTATLRGQTLNPEGLNHSEYSRQFRGYSLSASAFNTGVFAVNTEVIDEKTLSRLEELAHKYRNLAQFPEQLWMNLFFYRKWERLPMEYNLFATYLQTLRHVPAKDIDAVVMHFPRLGNRPGLRCWDTDNAFYSEWKNNYDRAELMDLKNIPKPVRRRAGLRRLVYKCRLRFALRGDYLSFYRSKLSIRRRIRGLLGIPSTAPNL